jgi:formamidopyrimidine-DNA glycosylase
MTKRVPTSARATRPWHTGPTQLLYWDRRGLGNIRLLTPQQYDVAFGPDVLGPDALAMTADLYRERLGRSSRPVKVALLDQHAVAGIGNLYASEILHVAGVHPGRPCRTKRRSVTKAPRSATARTATRSAKTAATKTNTECMTKPARPVRTPAAAARSCASSKPNGRHFSARDAKKHSLLVSPNESAAKR